MFLSIHQLYDRKGLAMFPGKIIYYVDRFTSISLAEENTIPVLKIKETKYVTAPNLPLGVQVLFYCFQRKWNEALPEKENKWYVLF